MNRGGGGERRHFLDAFLMLAQEWRSCASPTCGSQQAALSMPRFSPNSCPTSMQ